MEKLTAFDPKAEVSGLIILGFVQSVNKVDIMPYLTKHGLENTQVHEWYPQQIWLDVLSDILNSPYNSLFDLVSIGMKIGETVPLPPNIKTVDDALFASPIAYAQLHRNSYAGEIVVTRLGDRKIQLDAHTPYPDDSNYGTDYGYARRFLPPGTHFVVESNQAGKPRFPRIDDEHLIVTIAW